uniref:2'-5'-oligoadenylate synthetase 1 domain-containing protein n=1 Tax=Chromera velia CCMP2878 TaxID=1169474 RepID=A0A0G4HS06_9ALVE|eukprot:Cvel_8204.t1-p1 / transcript=Cvel_8204.t1 / gene=Cvel_8204 / organism=Chromera_velia_CCMP2878 / gene_product=hypothetical protein / transcript_product=hypothetical protein / location=Cvel_scaffold447:43999-47932(-) / protein_length=1083 / sequence_SO=supercontig / SO=protein_coding / is_pseudo=false
MSTPGRRKSGECGVFKVPNPDFSLRKRSSNKTDNIDCDPSQSIFANRLFEILNKDSSPNQPGDPPPLHANARTANETANHLDSSAADRSSQTNSTNLMQTLERDGDFVSVAPPVQHQQKKNGNGVAGGLTHIRKSSSNSKNTTPECADEQSVPQTFTKTYRPKVHSRAPTKSTNSISIQSAITGGSERVSRTSSASISYSVRTGPLAAAGGEGSVANGAPSFPADDEKHSTNGPPPLTDIEAFPSFHQATNKTASGPLTPPPGLHVPFQGGSEENRTVTPSDRTATDSPDALSEPPPPPPTFSSSANTNVDPLQVTASPFLPPSVPGPFSSGLGGGSKGVSHSTRALPFSLIPSDGLAAPAGSPLSKAAEPPGGKSGGASRKKRPTPMQSPSCVRAKPAISLSVPSEVAHRHPPPSTTAVPEPLASPAASPASNSDFFLLLSGVSSNRVPVPMLSPYAHASRPHGPNASSLLAPVPSDSGEDEEGCEEEEEGVEGQLPHQRASCQTHTRDRRGAEGGAFLPLPGWCYGEEEEEEDSFYGYGFPRRGVPVHEREGEGTEEWSDRGDVPTFFDAGFLSSGVSEGEDEDDSDGLFRGSGTTIGSGTTSGRGEESPMGGVGSFSSDSSGFGTEEGKKKKMRLRRRGPRKSKRREKGKEQEREETGADADGEENGDIVRVTGEGVRIFKPPPTLDQSTSADVNFPAAPLSRPPDSALRFFSVPGVGGGLGQKDEETFGVNAFHPLYPHPAPFRAPPGFSGDRFPNDTRQHENERQREEVGRKQREEEEERDVQAATAGMMSKEEKQQEKIRQREACLKADRLFTELHTTISSRAFNSRSAQTASAVAEWVVRHSCLRIREIVKAGNVGKGTAISGCASTDLVIAVENLPPSNFLKWLPPLCKSLAASLSVPSAAWVAVVAIRAEPDRVVVTTRGGMEVALFPVPFFETFEEASAVLDKMPPSQRPFLRPSLVKEEVAFVGKQPGCVKVTIRLLKWWRSQQAWSGDLYTPSDYLLELLCIFAHQSRRPKSQREAADAVVDQMKNFRDLRVVWNVKYLAEDLWGPLTLHAPLLADPVNRFRNVADPSVSE